MQKNLFNSTFKVVKQNVRVPTPLWCSAHPSSVALGCEGGTKWRLGGGRGGGAVFPGGHHHCLPSAPGSMEVMVGLASFLILAHSGLFLYVLL